MDQTTLLKIKSLYFSWRLFIYHIYRRFDQLLQGFSSLSCLIIIIVLFLEFAFHLETTNLAAYFLLHRLLISFFAFDSLLRVLFFKQTKWTYIYKNPINSLVLVVFIADITLVSFEINFFISQLLLFLILVSRVPHLQLLLTWLKVRPAQIIILAFLFIIFVGTLLLSLPMSTSSYMPVSFIDALFTSFSAVCVTGLTVNNIGSDFSFFGQIIILLLIQIGGLGIMSFSALLLLILKRKVSQSDTMRLQENYTTMNLKETFSAISFIFKFTFFFEFIGSLLLIIAWYTPDEPLKDIIFTAIFHSISAFCNAGFSLFSDSLIGFQFHFATISIISFLIIVGGLGFPVLFNLYQRFINNQQTKLRLQTRMALLVTIFLIIFGTLVIFCTEYSHSMSAFNWFEKLQLSFFQSVTTRTAGFVTTDITMFHPSTIMICLILMIIGASPVSTGGGIKTTTFALIVVSFWNIIKSSFRFDYQKKTIDPNSVFVAFATLFIAIFLICSFSFFLFLTDVAPIDQLLFEVVSAFGTVGLSLGVTSHLSAFGKLLIMSIMFIGRIGPFVFLYAFFQRRNVKHYSYPVEKVSIV
tara:strand:+ start:7806 stop:9551 length:1746 start_codon:yes stop_codon:yes gene_type:complete